MATPAAAEGERLKLVWGVCVQRAEGDGFLRCCSRHSLLPASFRLPWPAPDSPSPCRPLLLQPGKYREHYQLYEGKPCITDTAEECRKCLNARVAMIGKRLNMGVWGDPPNFTPPTPVGAASRGLHTSARATAPPPSAAAQPAFAAEAAQVVQPPRPLRPTGPAAGSDVPRTNVGIFGRMNVGKSTLMNTLTRQETSIVDATPGTTADVKVSLMELHAIGPAKLFDTAGIDEAGELGAKKRRKTLAALHECDVAVVVVDLGRHVGLEGAALAESLSWEAQLLGEAQRCEAVPLLVLNAKRLAGLAAGPAARAAVVAAVRAVLDPAGKVAALDLDLAGGVGSSGGVAAAPLDAPSAVSAFLQSGAAASRGRLSVPSLPEAVLAPGASVFLNIPMDAETPTMRLLRPQALVQEEAIR